MLLLIRFLGPQKYGVWNLLQSSVVVASFVFMFLPSFYRPMERFLPEYFKIRKTKLAFVLLLITQVYHFILNLSLYLLIYFYFSEKFEIMYNIEGFSHLLRIWGLWVLSDCFVSNGWTYVINARQRFDLQAVLNIVNISKDIAFVLLYHFADLSFETFVLLFMIGRVGINLTFFFVAVSIFPGIEGDVSKREVWQELKRMLRYLIPFRVSDLLELIPLNFGKTLVGKYFTLEEVGYFSAVVNIVSRAKGILYTVHVVSFPRMVKFSIENLRKFTVFFKRYIEFSVIFGLFSTLFGLLFSKEIMLVVGGYSFAIAYPILQTGVLELFVYAFSLPFKTFVYVKEKTWLTMITHAFTICFLFVFYFIFIHLHSLNGVVLSHVLGSLAGLIFLLFFLSKFGILDLNVYCTFFRKFLYCGGLIFVLYLLLKWKYASGIYQRLVLFGIFMLFFYKLLENFLFKLEEVER